MSSRLIPIVVPIAAYTAYLFCPGSRPTWRTAIASETRRYSRRPAPIRRFHRRHRQPYYGDPAGDCSRSGVSLEGNTEILCALENWQNAMETCQQTHSQMKDLLISFISGDCSPISSRSSRDSGAFSSSSSEASSLAAIVANASRKSSATLDADEATEFDDTCDDSGRERFRRSCCCWPVPPNNLNHPAGNLCASLVE